MTVPLYFRKVGQGPPLVILHGLFGSSDNWLSVAKVLQEKYTLYLLDAANHGQSPHTDTFNYASMVEDLKLFLESHQLLGAPLIGHSMGGKTVMRFAATYPSFVSKIVVVDISPRFYLRHHDTILDALHSIDLATLQSRQEADNKVAAFIGDFGVRQFLLKNLYRSEAGGFAWRINLDLLSSNIENVGEALPEGSSVTCPTLFIRGALSGYIESKDESIIQEHFTNYSIATVEGASHWVHAEKPAEVINLIDQFVQA